MLPQKLFGFTDIYSDTQGIVEESGAQVCGTPWAGKENVYTNTIMPLKAIILIERGEDNKIQKISFSDAFRFIMNQVYLPRDENKMTLKLIQELSSKVSLWRFQCNNFKDDCFNVVYEALEGRGE